MALDKQKILSELSSVMNKLQSADCGCMGKMFSNQGQYSNQGGQGGEAMGSPLPTCGGCRRGCCHGHGSSGYSSGYGSGYGGGYGGQSHGYSAPCAAAGEPNTMKQSCMGMQCNPPKLYADTYNYLSHNLMQPMVKEVYNDLKSINPANSVVNNPMASQMGLQQQSGGDAMQGNTCMMQNQMPGHDMGGMHNPNIPMNQQMGKQQMGNQQMGNQQIMGYQQMDSQQVGNQQMSNQPIGNQPMGNRQMSNQPMAQMMAGMGPNILHMMQGDGKSSKMPGQAGQFTSSMTAEAPQSVQGQSGMAQMNTPGGMNQGQYNTEMNNNPSYYGSQQVQSQYNAQQQNLDNAVNQNTMSGNMQQNPVNTGATYKVNYSNPAAQQMAAKPGQQNYGQHTPGVTKFNEMFPGVMQGGDLGFDPMSIAIQMNPANQHQAATNQMAKLMNGNKLDRIMEPGLNARTMQPAITDANAAANSINQSQTPTNQQINPEVNQQAMPVQPGTTQQNLLQGYSAGTQPNQEPLPIYNNQVPQAQQQVYTALTGAPTMTNQQPQQYQQQYQDPNAQAMASPNLPTQDGSFTNQPPPESSTPDQQIIIDPIFPADTSRNQPPPTPHMKYQRRYEYNTLGQPIELQPARLYHSAPDTNPQQTLSPQPVTKYRNDLGRLNVKNTVSKTSLMGSKPVGRIPSRSQLQQVYNQYKGSHSYTQQNIRSPPNGNSFSEGKLNVALADVNQHRRAPVEKLGGDTLANNQPANVLIPTKGQPMGHTGDAVPVDLKPQPCGDIIPAKDPVNPVIKNCRNGLQDMVYTSYPTSAAWSFHGHDERHPYSPGYRLRGRV